MPLLFGLESFSLSELLRWQHRSCDQARTSLLSAAQNRSSLTGVLHQAHSLYSSQFVDTLFKGLDVKPGSVSVIHH